MSTAAVATEAPAPKGGKKKLVVIAALAVAVLGGGGAGAYFFLKKPPEADKAAEAAAAKAAKTPVFIPFEPMVVNLKDEGAERMMQIAFSFEAADSHAADAIKVHTPAIRSRLIMLLTAKTSPEIAGRDGKQKLAGEILEETRAAIGATKEAPLIKAVHFTSIIVQ